MMLPVEKGKAVKLAQLTPLQDGHGVGDNWRVLAAPADQAGEEVVVDAHGCEVLRAGLRLACSRDGGLKWCMDWETYQRWHLVAPELEC